MSELALKLQFAKLLLKTPTEPFKAALALFPDNRNRALRVANEWPCDLEVIAAKEDAVEEVGEMAFLPTKAEACRKIWDKAHNTIMQPDEYTKMMKLYCDVRGFIEKPQTNIQNNVQNVSNRVMVVRENGTDEEWEEKLLNQQRKLTDAATD